MTNRPCKIAVAGTHSTGKTTFMRQLQEVLQSDGLTVEYVHDSAEDARNLGFPILTGHTFDSTAWMMAQAIRLETVASLTADAILIDRPVPDALGYLLAALKVTGRQIDAVRMERLLRICEAWVGEYDLIFVTELDRSIPIGPGRDDNEEFRIEAGEAVTRILRSLAPGHSVLRSDGVNEALALAKVAVDRHRSGT